MGRYRVLSAVFDGVPNPEEATNSSKADSLSPGKPDDAALAAMLAGPASRSSRHAVYNRQNCKECHDVTRGNALRAPQPTLCYQCHDSFSEQYSVLHGPVAAGYCTSCHSPHTAPFEHLLTRDGPDVCLKCHDRADVFGNDVHEGEEESLCIDCHSPHGGDDRFLF